MPRKTPENKNEPQKAKSKKDLSSVYRYSGMAMKMGIVIAAGVFGGQYIDEKTASPTPWFTLILSLFGVGMAIAVVINDTKPR